MHGREDGEDRKRIRHMWSVASRGSAATVGVDSGSSSSVNSFVKDGRKITVGDCALFKPPNDSPPFIGFIRSLSLDKDNNLKLCVNWLYRPAEVVLGKGVVLEAAPNEVFYSFHRDETLAASLLHYTVYLITSRKYFNPLFLEMIILNGNMAFSFIKRLLKLNMGFNLSLLRLVNIWLTIFS